MKTAKPTKAFSHPFASLADAVPQPALAIASGPASRQPVGGYGHGGKRLLDIALVVLTAPISLPLILLCALGLWIESGLPFYRQARLGRGGQAFQILKLRTMVRDADAQLAQYLDANPERKREWDETQKLRHDPRITRFGAFLRATSLDELPQLWNVLRGDMSLVGPRPMMVDQLPLYGNAQAYFALRPGITGLWQVGERNQSSFMARARFDGEYLDRLSLGLDLRTLARTVLVVVRRTGC